MFLPPVFVTNSVPWWQRRLKPEEKCLWPFEQRRLAAAVVSYVANLDLSVPGAESDPNNIPLHRDLSFEGGAEMAKTQNQAAIMIRAPKDPGKRKQYFRLMDCLADEIATNRKTKQGPKSQAAVFIAMAEERYAKQLDHQDRDTERKTQDARNKAKAKEAEDLF